MIFFKDNLWKNFHRNCCYYVITEKLNQFSQAFNLLFPARNKFQQTKTAKPILLFGALKEFKWILIVFGNDFLIVIWRVFLGNDNGAGNDEIEPIQVRLYCKVVLCKGYTVAVDNVLQQTYTRLAANFIQNTKIIICKSVINCQRSTL